MPTHTHTHTRTHTHLHNALLLFSLLINNRYRAARVVETLGMVYSPHYPYKSKHSARMAKRSPFHEVLVNKRFAYCKDVSGWEAKEKQKKL